MKRVARDPKKFDLIRIVDHHARSRGLDIREHANQAGVIEALREQLESNRTNDILHHGLRVQSMFSYVAAALGECRVIKEEDAGELYSEEAEIQAPDFRVLTKAGRQLLVEVKNCHAASAHREFRLTRSYMDRLRAYASLFGVELFIAIYWSQLRLWVLVQPDDFELRSDDYVIPLVETFKRNNMRLLGDCMIGTTPSLTMKFVTDPAKPRRVDASGQAQCTIARVDIYSGDRIVEDSFERELAWFLLSYGKWPGHDLPAEVVDGDLVSMGFRMEPEERVNPDQEFEIIGFLSEMVARQYNDITAPEGAVKLLSPKHDPSDLGVLIPSDYRGEAVPIWRLSLSPSAPVEPGPQTSP